MQHLFTSSLLSVKLKTTLLFPFFECCDRGREGGREEKGRGRTYEFYFKLKYMSSHTWAGCICLIWIVWQDKLFGWSVQGFVEEWTELLSKNGINFSEKFQYICKFQHTHFHHVNGNMYIETCSFQSSDRSLGLSFKLFTDFWH